MFAFNNSISQNTAQPHAFLLEGKLQSFMIFFLPSYPLDTPDWKSKSNFNMVSGREATAL